MQRRQKASDVFRETEFLIARKTSSFSEVFPDVEDVEVEITEERKKGCCIQRVARPMPTYARLLSGTEYIRNDSRPTPELFKTGSVRRPPGARTLRTGVLSIYSSARPELD